MRQVESTTDVVILLSLFPLPFFPSLFVLQLGNEKSVIVEIGIVPLDLPVLSALRHPGFMVSTLR